MKKFVNSFWDLKKPNCYVYGIFPAWSTVRHWRYHWDNKDVDDGKENPVPLLLQSQSQSQF